MSDDPNAQGTASGPSWTPPPAGATPPPPPQQDAQAYQAGPGPDPSGGVPQAVRSGPTISLHPQMVGQVLLGVLSFVGVLLGLILKVVDKENTGRADAEGKVQLWDTMGWTWAWLALVAAALMLLPAIGSAINLSSQLTRTITSVAAGTLIFWWVLFILPYIGLTTAFLATLGVAAGVGAVWLSRDKGAADS